MTDASLSEPYLIDRRFVRLQEGLVHVREMAAREMAGAAQTLPLVLMHPSPASARGLEPFMHALRGAGLTRTLIAPDTLGNGDSAAPAPDHPDIAYYADSVRRVLDALKIDRAHIYGAHTGCRTAAELAIIAPDRVASVIFDGIVEYEPDLRRQILEHYAPAVEPDEMGQHLLWAFNFVRDQVFHFPYFLRDPAHTNTRVMPSAEQLHAHTVDVLKGLTTYHKAYRAAFEYEPSKRLPLIRKPVLVLEADTEPAHLKKAAADMAALVPGSTLVKTAGGITGKAQAIAASLKTQA
ncbi:MAG: alpha/beta fold hydrolase [Rhodospirillaceae bacterium]|nr:alpha/beta fold hydrolase [Rhodospirillaceae bacterium]